MFPLDDIIMLLKYTDPIQKKISKGNLLIEKKTALHLPLDIMITSVQKE